MRHRSRVERWSWWAMLSTLSCVRGGGVLTGWRRGARARRGAGRGGGRARGAGGGGGATCAHTTRSCPHPHSPARRERGGGGDSPHTLSLSTRRPYTVRNLAPPSYFLNLADSVRNVVTWAGSLGFSEPCPRLGVSRIFRVHFTYTFHAKTYKTNDILFYYNKSDRLPSNL